VMINFRFFFNIISGHVIVVVVAVESVWLAWKWRVVVLFYIFRVCKATVAYY
jgi:F0F1-type ATP synthase membrane subunit a